MATLKITCRGGNKVEGNAILLIEQTDFINSTIYGILSAHVYIFAQLLKYIKRL